MTSKRKIAEGTRIWFEKTNLVRLFPSEYGNDDKFHMPIFIEGPCHQGIFKTEVGRAVIRDQNVDIIYQIWKNGKRTSQFGTVNLKENGLPKDWVVSNIFAIAIANASITYGTTIQAQLNDRHLRMGSVAVFLGYICDSEMLIKLYAKIVQHVKAAKLLGD
jgi:hypothetical protein